MSTIHRSARAIVLSRHRLRDHTVAERIVAASGLAPPDLVLEIGAGDGRLTVAIARAAGRVVAVEIDPAEYRQLVGATSQLPNVRPVLGDFLTLTRPAMPYKVVANIPFSLTSDIIRQLVFGPRPPESAHLVVERTAALRWLGWERQSILSVLAQVNFEFDTRLALRRVDFEPRPAHAPVLLELRRRTRPLVRRADYPEFEAFVRRGFGGGGGVRRNLSSILGRGRARRVAAELSLDPGAAPSSLVVDDWIRLFAHLGNRRRT